MHYVIPWQMYGYRSHTLFARLSAQNLARISTTRSGAKMAHRYYKAEGFARILAGGRAGQHLLISTVHRRFSYSRVIVDALAARGLLVRWASY